MHRQHYTVYRQHFIIRRQHFIIRRQHFIIYRVMGGTYLCTGSTSLGKQHCTMHGHHCTMQQTSHEEERRECLRWQNYMNIQIYATCRGQDQGCIRRGGTSEAVRWTVGGGRQSGWGRLMSVTNAIEAGTCRQEDSGWA